MLLIATLIGVVSEAVSPPMVNLVCPSRLAFALWLFLFLQGVFQHLGYFLALSSQPFSSMDSLKGSYLEGSVDFFCPSDLLVIHRPNSLEVSLLSAQLADLLGSSCPYVTFSPRVISKVLGSNTLRLKGCRRKSCPCLRLFSSRDEEGLLGWLLHSHRGLTWMANFPRSVSKYILM